MYMVAYVTKAGLGPEPGARDRARVRIVVTVILSVVEACHTAPRLLSSAKGLDSGRRSLRVGCTLQSISDRVDVRK